MRIKSIVFAVATFAAMTPAVANAQTCYSAYLWCLNDTWNTSGWARTLADLACGAGYAGCLRKLLM